MSALLRIEPPTDPQLVMIARLCREQGWTPPGAVYSKTEASEIISAMLESTYDTPDDPRRDLAPEREPEYADLDPVVLAVAQRIGFAPAARP